MKDFFSKCDQIRRKPKIWSHLLKISLMENFIFYAVILLCQSTGDGDVDDDSGSGDFCSIVK